MDSFSFECRGYAKIEGTRGGDGSAEAARCGIGGKGRGGLCQWFRWGRVDDKVREGDERDARKTSPQPGRRLRGDKVTGRKETRRKETGHKQTGRKEMGATETGGKETGGKETAAKETGRKETFAKKTGRE